MSRLVAGLVAAGVDGNCGQPAADLTTRAHLWEFTPDTQYDARIDRLLHQMPVLSGSLNLGWS